MANVIPDSFKTDLLKGTFNFDSSGGSTFKLALYTDISGLTTSSTAFTTTNEVSTSGTPSTSVTYLSNKYQDLLLYAALVEAYGYLKGPTDMLQYYESSYRRALQSYSIEQQGRRRRDEYQDGVIRPPLQSPSP